MTAGQEAGSTAGAIVQITSMGGRLSFAGVGGYSATKFALEGLSEALAPEVASFGITVLIVEPGAFRTGLHRAGTRQESAAIAAYAEVLGPVRAQQAGFDGQQPGPRPWSWPRAICQARLIIDHQHPDSCPGQRAGRAACRCLRVRRDAPHQPRLPRPPAARVCACSEFALSPRTYSCGGSVDGAGESGAARGIKAGCPVEFLWTAKES